tara:strand:+ start:87 stop:332 length:246 start_codon:yes stop_codon:yes gene_type:complete
MGKDLALYVGAFMVCTMILIIPGIIFLLYWAVTRNDDQVQYVEHHHHYEDNRSVNIQTPEGSASFKYNEKNNNFQGYLNGN